MLPLDEYVEIIRKRFPKYISIDETKCNIMKKKHSVLFRKEHYNEYCFLEYTEGCEAFSITLFKCDYKDFDKIENEYLDGVSFAVTLSDIKTIMNSIV